MIKKPARSRFLSPESNGRSIFLGLHVTEVSESRLVCQKELEPNCRTIGPGSEETSGEFGAEDELLVFVSKVLEGTHLRQIALAELFGDQLVDVVPGPFHLRLDGLAEVPVRGYPRHPKLGFLYGQSKRRVWLN